MEDLLKFYHNECNESARLDSQAGKVEFLTTMHYLQRVCSKNAKILDACAGGGIYSFPLAELGFEVTAGDLIDVNVQHIKNINDKKPVLKEIYEGDILDLSRFKDESFDVVLNLGSYYHMCNKTERLSAVKESLRVLKKGGIYLLAYINRYANYISHCQEMNADIGFFERFMESGHIDNNYIFYTTTPEMLEAEINEFNLVAIHNIGTDGPIFAYRDTVDKMKTEVFDRFMRMHLDTCETMSNLGCSEHGLFIAKK